MHSEPAMAPPATPVAGIDPRPVNPGAAGARPHRTAASPGRSAPVRLARKVLSVLRGDKYLIGAYPPEWQASSRRPADVRHGGEAGTAADAVSATPSKGR